MASWVPSNTISVGPALGLPGILSGLVAPKPSDISCSQRHLLPISTTSASGITLDLSALDISSLGLELLLPIGLDQYVHRPTPAAAPPASWPFPVEAHPAASASLAKSMVQRLKGDIKLHAKQTAARPKPILLGFSPKELQALVQMPGVALPAAEGKASALLNALLALRAMDAQKAGQCADLALDLAKGTAGGGAAAEVDARGRKAFALSRLSGFVPKAWFELLVTFLLSSKGETREGVRITIGCGHFHP